MCLYSFQKIGVKSIGKSSTKTKRRRREVRHHHHLLLLCMTFVFFASLLNPSKLSVSSFTLRSSRRTKLSSVNFLIQKMSSVSQENAVAKIVPSSDLEECGSRIRAGHLVSFPTETVYGLGCHALDTTAVARVFRAKERPTTDPLIVHLNSAEQALPLWKVSKEEEECLQILMNTFWPGPLTLVARANDEVIPPLLTADTGFVACRSPSHSLARDLIDAARVPIAAPSANKFGHVSPTQAQHVFDDLHQEDVWIIQYQPEKSCQVGVESTVVKVEWDSTSCSGTVNLLRHGAVSATQIQKALQQTINNHDWEMMIRPKHTSEKTPNVAPGQSIRHYSPHCDCFMISSQKSTLEQDEKSILSKAVVLDYAGQLKFMRNHCLAYRDLSSSGNSQEASASLFETLRWSESIPNATRVFIPEIIIPNGNDEDNSNQYDDALLWAVQDRLTRAASGIIIKSLT